MTEEQKAAIKKVVAELVVMPPEEFRAELEKHKDGDLYHIIHEMLSQPAQPPAPPGAEEAAEKYVSDRLYPNLVFHEDMRRWEKSAHLAGSAFERDRASKEIAELREELKDCRLAGAGNQHVYQEENARLRKALEELKARVKEFEEMPKLIIK